MVEIVKLDGNFRKEVGSSASRNLRKQGRLPVVVYGDSFNNVFLDIDAREFEKEYFKGGIETRIFEFRTERGEFRAICCQVAVDPVSDRPSHVDFLSIVDKKEIRTLIPIKFLNVDKSAGLKKGGYFNVLVRKLPLICNVDQVPGFLEVNCENLKLKQSIRLSHITLPAGSRAVSKKDILIARIIGRGKKDSEATATSTTLAAPTAGSAATTANTATGASTARTASGGGHVTSKK
ncbi:MAG: 50S ribosomal protein L25/general stress protein Ctc [Rickettsiales bacterium]|jgi:large subunit ribosomal protein L25|nr:50S ribosomal protein L25/general stress protein Ctc [Rickettsiales bacterium]